MAGQNISMRNRAIHGPFVCGCCGKQYMAKAADRNKYCSRECGFAGQRVSRALAKAERHAPKQLAADRIRLIRKLLSLMRERARIKQANELKYMKATTPCAVCGGPCGYLFGRPRTLCVQCAEQRAIEVRRLHHKQVRQRFGTSHRKRARRYGVEYEPVDKRMVFERDGWRCQICGKPTPRNKMGRMVSNAPELDHRVPISRGGGHTYSNTQCSCRQCNGAKGNSRETGQLPMFQHQTPAGR